MFFVCLCHTTHFVQILSTDTDTTGIQLQFIELDSCMPHHWFPNLLHLFQSLLLLFHCTLLQGVGCLLATFSLVRSCFPQSTFTFLWYSILTNYHCVLCLPIPLVIGTVTVGQYRSLFFSCYFGTQILSARGSQSGSLYFPMLHLWSHHFSFWCVHSHQCSLPFNCTPLN